MKEIPSSLDIATIEPRLIQGPEMTDALRRIQAFELQSYLPGDLLPKEDRATMAVGLEARVPILGAELVELAERASDDQKVGLFAGKRVLRDLARRRLPTYVTRARKRGFAVPLAQLFAGRWRSEAVDWFADSSSLIVDGPRAAQLLRSGDLPATDAWALAMMIGWEQSVDAARHYAGSSFRQSVR
jgi:asparagine synthase (glutamine-hydrolysing)